MRARYRTGRDPELDIMFLIRRYFELELALMSADLGRPAAASA